MTEGDAHGQPFTFPIPTVNITEEFDWYGENTDILFENTAKIGLSYLAQNFIGSQYTYDETKIKLKIQMPINRMLYESNVLPLTT